MSFTVHWFGDSDLTVTVGIRDGIRLLSNVTKVIKKGKYIFVYDLHSLMSCFIISMQQSFCKSLLNFFSENEHFEQVYSNINKLLLP